MAVKLYVGNLAYTTMEDSLRSLFDQAGTVISCEFVLDKFTGKPRGFAFVEMSSQEEAEKAAKEFNEYEFEGRKLVVNEARPRENRSFGGGPPSGGYGGGGGGGGGYGGKRKSGKGSRRGSRSAKRDKKAFW
jgi:RNA recognition motif-containing protein